MRLRYSREALSQIGEITEDLAAHSPSAALRFILRIASLAERVAVRPGIGRLTEVPKLHVIPAKPFPFLMFYAVHDDDVTIIKIRHMSRNEDWRRGL